MWSEICFDSDASALPYVSVYSVCVSVQCCKAEEEKVADSGMRFPLIFVCEICSSSAWWPESRISSVYNEIQ